jgi:hypothetical protein
MAEKNMSSLKERIMSDAGSKGFVESLVKFKNPTKRMIKDLGHSSILSDVIGDNVIGKDIVATIGNKINPFIEILDSSVEEYNEFIHGTERGNKTADEKMDFFVKTLFGNYAKAKQSDQTIGEVITIAENVESVKKVATKLHQDGLNSKDKSGELKSLMESVIVLSIAKYLLIEAFNGNFATDENGDHVSVETMKPESNNHHQDQTATEPAKEPVIVEESTEPKDVESKSDDSDTATTGNDTYEIVEKDFSKLIEGVGEMVFRINESTPDEEVKDTAGKLRPHVSTIINNIIVDNDVNSSFDKLTDSQKYAVDFYAGVFSNMLPATHKSTVKGVSVDRLIKSVAMMGMSDIDLNDSSADAYESSVTLFAMYADLIYSALGAVVLDKDMDVIDFYKVMLTYAQIDDNDEDATKKSVCKMTENLEDKINRVNRAIESKDERPYKVGMYIVRGAQERQASQFLKDGIAAIKKSTAA